jgi:hypothetical protein
VIFEPEKKTFISRHLLYQHWYIYPIALPVHRNPQHWSLLTVVSTTSSPPFQPHHHQRNVYHPAVSRFTEQTLPTINRIPLWISFALSPFDHRKKTHNRTLLYGSTVLKHGRHFDHWNQPLNMFMRFCHVGCREPGLCCYQLIHIETYYRPLQLFYFHSWPIYWRSPVDIGDYRWTKWSMIMSFGSFYQSVRCLIV